MVTLDAAQERTYRTAIAVARNPAEAVRITFMFLTESNGRNLANDGAAFADDYAINRPGWAEGLPTKQRRDIYALLRKSLDMPNDGVGNNGGSTGPGQQLSQDYVSVRFPGKTGGYGSIADTMDATKAATMFRDRLVVTDNREYAGLDFDPIAADVLRVQQPLVSERESDNYSDAQVTKAKAIVAQLNEPTTQGDWFMANNWDEAKAEVAAMIAANNAVLIGKIHDDLVSVLRAPEFSTIDSAVNGANYPTKAIIGWTDMHTSNIEAATKFLVEQAGGVAVPSTDHAGNFSYKKAEDQ